LLDKTEDTSKYSEISRFFKIVGRSQCNSGVIRTVKAYLEESWEGDLLDLLWASLGRFSLTYGAYLNNKILDKYGFFKKVSSCNHECSHCDYCEELARS
jgi:collagenase-like PrtC family protease